KKADFGIVVLEPLFLRLYAFGKRAVDQVERPGNVLDHRLEAASTGHLDLGFELAVDANLSIHKLGRGSDFQGADLLHFGGLVVDAARRVGLVDRQFADSQILDVEKHAVCSASGAYAHA